MAKSSTTRPRSHLQQQVTSGTGVKGHYYGPVSLNILAGFLDDDDEEDVLPHPGLQRPSSTVAVVNGGGSDTPTPPPRPAYLPPPLRGGFKGYKPASRDLLGGFLDEDGEDKDETGTTGGTKIKTQTPAPLPTRTRGYKPASRSLLSGFSDNEEEDDDEWEDLYGISDDEGHPRNKRSRTEVRSAGGSGETRTPSTPSRIGLSRTEQHRDAGTRNGKAGDEPLIDLSDRGAVVVDVVESRQTDTSVAFRRNQGSVAPSDLPGYFAPEDLSFGQRYQVASTTTSTTTTTTTASTSNIIVTNQRTLLTPTEGEHSRECIVCTDTLPIATSFPSASITASCKHPPSTCLDCIATSIRTDLNTKLWNEIRCPECLATLQYDDVQRFADQDTKERYQTLSFRYAVSAADNFLWCTKGCGYGQVHDGGNENPIVICMLCSARSCFYHKSAWHENLSCDEYDALQQDPLNFRSKFELENEAAEEEMRRRRMQEDADRAFAQSLLDEDTRDRERERLERERLERERREKEERKERERREKELRKERELAAKRKKDEEASHKKIDQTTKPCPKCGAPIEKNRGCSHMTCTRCKHEWCWACGAYYFLPDGKHHDPYCGLPRPGTQCHHQYCWDCGASYMKILEQDNSVHGKECPWHPDNLQD